jgi:hypothetical protein
VGWPGITWTSDPVRRHRKPESRSLSARVADRGAAGYPQWDHYAETAVDYALPNDAPTTALRPHIMLYVAFTWTPADVTSFLNACAGAVPTIDRIAAQPDALRSWVSSPAGAGVPPGFVEHVILASRDVVRNNARKAYRRLLHRRGVLRTNEMVRYYTLPVVKDSGPAMPKALEQPAGKHPANDYTWLGLGAEYHPLFTPADHARRDFYNA